MHHHAADFLILAELCVRRQKSSYVGAPELIYFASSHRMPDDRTVTIIVPAGQLARPKFDFPAHFRARVPLPESEPTSYTTLHQVQSKI